MRSRLRSLVQVAILVGALLATSCSTASPSSSGTPSTSPSGTTAPAKPTGRVIIAPDFASGILDPQGETGAAFNGLSSAIFEPLVSLTPDGQFGPGVAERYEISPDGKSHTFYIRKGVKFHDGSDLTGTDVKFSIERMMATESLSASAASWRSSVAGVDLKDDYTVVIRMKTPQFELLHWADANMTTVFPKKYIEEKGADYFKKNPIGSGPYKVVRYDTGNRLELEANENYWDSAHIPQFKNITVLNVPEESTRNAMLKTGELDIAPVSPDSAVALKTAGLHIFSWSGAQSYIAYVFYDVQNPDKYALGDVRVRKALVLAANRQEVVDNIFRGYADRTILYPMSPKTYFLDANLLKVDPYDPDQAKKLLSEAGYASGFNTRIYDTAGQGALATVNQALAGYWRKIGVTAELVPIEYGSISAKFNPKQVPEIWNSVWTYPAPTSMEFNRLVTTYSSTKGAPKNTRNPKLDELLDKVPGTPDPAERKKLASQAAVLAHDEYSSLPLVDVDPILALSSKVGEVTPYPGANKIFGRMFASITHGK